MSDDPDPTGDAGDSGVVVSADHNEGTGSGTLSEYPNGITQAEVDELQEIFNLVDTDRGGSIEPEEVTNLLNTLGIKTTQEEGRNHMSSLLIS